VAVARTQILVQLIIVAAPVAPAAAPAFHRELAGLEMLAGILRLKGTLAGLPARRASILMLAVVVAVRVQSGGPHPQLVQVAPAARAQHHLFLEHQ
jgi:hypothetical protein